MGSYTLYIYIFYGLGSLELKLRGMSTSFFPLVLVTPRDALPRARDDRCDAAQSDLLLSAGVGKIPEPLNLVVYEKLQKSAALGTSSCVTIASPRKYAVWSVEVVCY